jgi:hypothetical protein
VTSSEIDALRQRAQQWLDGVNGWRLAANDEEAAWWWGVCGDRDCIVVDGDDAPVCATNDDNIPVVGDVDNAKRIADAPALIRDLLAALEAQQRIIDRNECSLCDTSRLSTYDKAAILAFNERAEARKR